MKKYFRLMLILLALLIQFNVVASVEADWAYRFVVYDGNVYVVTSEEIEKSKINRKLGEVTYYSDVEGTYGGNFSNTYSEGTQYFEINGVDVLEAIAIQTMKDEYIKATYNGEYVRNGFSFHREEITSTGISEDNNEGIILSILLCTLFLLVFVLVLNAMQKKSKY